MKKEYKNPYWKLLRVEWAVDHFDPRLKEKIDFKIEYALNLRDYKTPHIFGYYTDHTGSKTYWGAELGKYFDQNDYVEWFTERADYLKSPMYIKKAIVDSGIHPTQYKSGVTQIGNSTKYIHHLECPIG